MARIFVSIPTVSGEVHQKLITTFHSMSQEHELVFRGIEHCSLITSGRQSHFGMWYNDKSYDYLLSLDSDMMIMSPGCLDIMIARRPSGSLIGGTYAKKAIDPRTGFPPYNGNTLDGKPLVMDGSLVEMENIATGFMLIARDVADKMVQGYPELEYEMEDFNIKTWALYNTGIVEKNGRKQFMGEDFQFCKRCRDIGIPVYCDTNVMLGHIGSWLYTLHHLIPKDQL